jgi:hypothetical protein
LFLQIFEAFGVVIAALKFADQIVTEARRSGESIFLVLNRCRLLTWVSTVSQFFHSILAFQPSVFYRKLSSKIRGVSCVQLTLDIPPGSGKMIA